MCHMQYHGNYNVTVYCKICILGYNECHQKYKNKKVSYRKQIAFMSKISGQCKGLGQPCKISPHLVCLLTTQNILLVLFILCPCMYEVPKIWGTLVTDPLRWDTHTLPFTFVTVPNLVAPCQTVLVSIEGSHRVLGLLGPTISEIRLSTTYVTTPNWSY